MDNETSSFVMGTGERISPRRQKLLRLRQGLGLGYGIGAYGFPGGPISGVQTPPLGEQFGGAPPDGQPSDGGATPTAGSDSGGDGGAGGAV